MEVKTWKVWSDIVRDIFWVVTVCSIVYKSTVVGDVVHATYYRFRKGRQFVGSSTFSTFFPLSLNATAGVHIGPLTRRGKVYS